MAVRDEMKIVRGGGGEVRGVGVEVEEGRAGEVG
jgi:hypothetical protein